MYTNPLIRSSIAAAVVVFGCCGTTRAKAPWDDAAAVWDMSGASGAHGNVGPMDVEGDVQLGAALAGAEREASLKRGGDGRVARFNGGFLRVNFPAGRAASVAGKKMTLCLRLRDPSGAWAAPLLAKDDPRDEYGNLLDGRDRWLHYVWRSEPIERRALTAGGSGALYGFNGESNDQHHLSPYRPGEFAVSVLTLDEAGLVTLFHNGQKASGSIDPNQHKIGDRLTRVGAKHTDQEFLEGDIAEVVAYDRVVSAQERLGIEDVLRKKWGLGTSDAAGGESLPAAGMVLHLDAAAASGVPGDPAKPGPLAAWKDTSGCGHTVAQSDAAKQPELVAGALAGKPVVRFRGRQYLDGPAVLKSGAKRLTFIAVWKRDHAAGSQVIFEQSSPGRGRRACLLTTGSGGGNSDFVNGVLRLRVPATLIDPAAWHDVVVRFRGPNLELFVDGVLVDEEWPHGALFGFHAPFLVGAGYENGKLRSGFRGQVDHAAVWSRALKDEEILSISGGAEEVARRDRQFFGPPQTSMQYWKPRGYNAFAGDCMPFFHEGTFHLYYLFDRRHHGSKWGQGAHQYAHASSKDLIHWEHHPLAVPIVEQWECSMGTCDCIWHDGVYHMFYTDCGSRCEYRDKPQQGSWIFAATSTDGIQFHKDLKPLVSGGDCTVFRDPATGLFHLIRGGGNRLVSKDLRHWEEMPGDFVERKPGTTGECPHLFPWNGWFYFILGTNAVWKSRSALGPWEEMKPTIYDGLFVPKVAEFTGNRRILTGFLFDRGWAGNLALRELIQYPDGSLGIKFPPELIPACGEPLHLPRSIDLAGDSQPFRYTSLVGVPRNVRITLRVVPQAGAKAFGLCLRAKGNYEGGCELRFEPGRQRVQYGVPDHGGPAKDSTGRIAEGRDFAIENVENLDRVFTLDIVVKSDIVDTCIDSRRTMITRRDPEPDGDRVFFFTRGGAVKFENIVVRPLAGP